MESARYLECLAADAARLRFIAAENMSAPVPSCPEWTVTELVRHVAVVYLHKTEAMRRGAWPSPWPPDVSGEGPLDLFDRAYAGLVAEFAARKPDEPTVTWYQPEQTVGFWLRRMAQETVIHRVDAELALAAPFAPIPDDLAVDGIDEVLVRFLDFGSKEWTEDFGDRLASCDGRVVLVRSAGAAWSARLEPTGVTVTSGEADQHHATADGDPTHVLLWLWRRVGDEAVRLEGDPALIGKVRELLGDATR